MHKEESIFKVVTLGEGRVGKTSLITRYVNNNFMDQTECTQQAYCLEKVIKLKNDKVKVSIWDTAGQERFNALAPVYYKNADAAIIVYDVTIKETLEKARKWIQELKEFSLNDKIIIIIVGNKCDLTHQMEVSQQMIEEICTDNNAQHIYASAKSSKGVADIFQNIGQQLNQIQQTGNKSGNTSLRANRKKQVLTSQEPRDNSGCQC